MKRFRAEVVQTVHSSEPVVELNDDIAGCSPGAQAEKVVFAGTVEAVAWAVATVVC
jgi:hypothetical protein